MNDTARCMQAARDHGTAIPAFNIPYLPMIAPVLEALKDTETFGFIAVARLEWVKFKSGSLQAVAEEYRRLGPQPWTRLHLDHIPVVDEDGHQVDALALLREAVECGYDSVMIDASRLPLSENIAWTRDAVSMAHADGVPVEAELGAVLGHEAGPLPSYEELFASGAGFTDVDEAGRFVAETGVDWLSVAIGSVHGAISATRRHQTKVAARLHLERLAALRQATGIPLVLHGGTGIPAATVRAAIARGIAKINIATAIRQPYEKAVADSEAAAQRAVYEATVAVLTEERLAGSARLLLSDERTSHG